MKTIDRLSVIRHKSKINKDWKYKDLFQIFNKDEIWLFAYKNIRYNKIPLLPIITKDTLDIIHLKRLKTLREKVFNQNYQFKTLNEITAINNSNDKIVQEVIRIIVIAIYGPCFKKQGFKFGQNLGTHDILEYIELKFQWVDWIVEGIYSTIDSKQFYKILNKKIKDIKFLNLIYKLIKYEVLPQKNLIWSKFGIPQKNILSVIFINIYYNELDKWLREKIKILNQRHVNQQNRNYKKLCYYTNKKIDQLKTLDKRLKIYKIFLKELKIIKSKKVKINNLLFKPIQIEYVRYKNNWIVGIRGSQFLAKQLRIEVNLFSSIKLKQIIYPIKTKIINLWTGKVNFLGYEIYFLQNEKSNTFIYPRTEIINTLNFKLQFDIPINLILKIMEKRGYIKNFVNGYRSISKINYTTFNDTVIIKYFMQVQARLINYYSGCNNITKLQFINYLLQLSCAMTLTHKHQSSIKKILLKYGKLLILPNSNFKTYFPLQKKWKTKLNFIDPFHNYMNKMS